MKTITLQQKTAYTNALNEAWSWLDSGAPKSLAVKLIAIRNFIQKLDVTPSTRAVVEKTKKPMHEEMKDEEEKSEALEATEETVSDSLEEDAEDEDGTRSRRRKLLLFRMHR